MLLPHPEPRCEASRVEGWSRRRRRSRALERPSRRVAFGDAPQDEEELQNARVNWHKLLIRMMNLNDLNLDFVPPDLEFVPPGLDFVPKNLDFLPLYLDFLPWSLAGVEKT
jgi:hypothetical protein